MTEAKPKDYWISPSALKMFLNALSDPDYMQASAASGAMIMVYMKGIEGLEFDHGHNYKRWPLKLSPTYFTTPTRKYVYVKIPRPVDDPADVATDVAMVCFPSEKLDLYGKDEGGIQVGDEAYYYIFLQGIISGGEPTVEGLRRRWEQEIDWGTLNSDEAIDGGGTGEWWKYDPITDTVTFLKTIAYAVFDYLKAAQAEIHNLNVTGTFDAIKGYIDDIRSHNFSSGLLDGSGYRLTNDNGEGSSEMEVDFLKVRKKATFMELEIRKETFVGGNQHYSPAGSVIYQVDYIDVNGERLGYTVMKVPFLLKRMAFLGRIFNYAARRRIKRQMTEDEWRNCHHIRCYLLADDGTTATRNWWQVGDQPRCQAFNRAVSVDNKRSHTYNSNGVPMDDPATPEPIETAYWWRLISNTGSELLEDGHAYDYFDVPYEGWYGYSADEKRAFRDAGSDIPVAGDTCVCMGNRTNEERMNLISIYTTGRDNNPPAIKGRRGIHSFNFENTLVFEISPEQVLFRSKDFKFFDDSGYEFPVPLERGQWQYGQRYHWYDRVSWNGAIWLCQMLDDYVWENANGTEYPAYQVEDIEYGEGNFTYSVHSAGDEIITGTDHYYRRGKVNGQTVYYIRLYTYSEPSENNQIWLKEIDKGRNGIDGEGSEYVFIRTADNTTTPYITTSSDTYEDKTYLDDDYLPLSNIGRCTDDPIGPTRALPYEWVIKRTKADPDPTTGERLWHKYGEGQYEGRMALWATYSENAVRLDLDNENDSMLYSSAKGLISGNVTTTGTLFDGMSDVSSQATWSLLSVSGCTATISGRTVTVTAMSAASGSVVIQAIYKNVTYTATLTLKKIVDGDKYDLVITPSSIAYNATTDSPATTQITVQVWRMSADGTRTMAAPPSGYATYLLDGNTQLTYSAASSFTYDVDNSARGDITVKIAKGYTSTEYLDCETVPIAKSVNGQNVVRMDLDNENDTMLYSSAKGLISGNVVTTGSLFDGMTDVSAQATWSIQSSSGCTATISGRTVTVTAMSAASGSVVIQAIYKNVTYTATLTLKKIVDGDKYDLVITPSSIAYNATTDTPATTQITVQVWRMSADGTRTMAAPPSGYATYLLDGSTQLTYSAASSFTYDVDNSARGDITVKIAKGYTSTEYLDCETVPITKTVNGQKGENGTNGKDGKYNIEQYARSSSRTYYSYGYIDSSIGWQDTAPATTNTYMYIWKRTAVYDPNTGTQSGWTYVCLTGADGKAGGKGDAGHVGRWYYYAGEWVQGQTYYFDATKAPYVSRGADFYMLDFASDPATQQSSTTASTTKDPASYHDGNPWSPMLAVFKYIITEATFASFANLGSFIINGDWMISQYGGPDGKTYQDFDPFYFGFYIQGLYPSYSGFVPNFAVDGKTGTTYQNKAYVRGKITAESGMIGKFSIESDGSLNASSASMVLTGKSGSRDASLVVNGQTQTYGLSVGVGDSWSANYPYSLILRGTDFTLPDPETSGIKLGAMIFVKSTKSSGIKVIATSNSRILSGTWELKQQSDIGGASAFYILSMDQYQSHVTGVTAWIWTEFFCP